MTRIPFIKFIFYFIYSSERSYLTEMVLMPACSSHFTYDAGIMENEFFEYVAWLEGGGTVSIPTTGPFNRSK